MKDAENAIFKIYTEAIEDGWYKGSIDEFKKFMKRSHWVGPCNFERELSPEEEARLFESYSLALTLYYRGTFQDFKNFTSKRYWGPVGGPGDPGVV